MAGSKRDNSKKVEGNARKADAAAKKAAAEDARKESAEAQNWEKGAKDTSRKEADAAKKVELAKKKAERLALLAEEEHDTPGRSTPKKTKAAVKKTANKGLDLSQLDDSAPVGPLAALTASGIDNALDALSLTAEPSSADAKIDRHPERRYKASYLAYEERRLGEMEADGTGQGLRTQQRKDKIRKEFEKHPDNPFNQVSARYNSTKEDVQTLREQEKAKIESRLADTGSRSPS